MSGTAQFRCGCGQRLPLIPVMHCDSKGCPWFLCTACMGVTDRDGRHATAKKLRGEE